MDSRKEYAWASLTNQNLPSFSTIPDPPGYVRSEASSSKKSKVSIRQPPSKEEVEALRQKRAWDVATAPAKQIPMQGFMLYMSGTGVQIFSMMVVGMLLTNPIKAIMTIKTSFAPYSTPGKENDLLLHKIVFIACQLACVGLGIYKCWSMGLLPTASSDWLAWREPRTVSGNKY